MMISHIEKPMNQLRAIFHVIIKLNIPSKHEIDVIDKIHFSWNLKHINLTIKLTLFVIIWRHFDNK